MVKTEPLGSGVIVRVSDEHHFSTDTILLADFAAVKAGDKVVDLGTGCGTIPLLWIRSGAPQEIAAVEIQQEAVELLSESIELNIENGVEAANRIKPILGDIKELKGKLPLSRYDVVVCNPPYKPNGAGLKNPNSAKSAARHETECSLDDICRAASSLLRFSGRFCICLRPERLADAFECMRNNRLEPKRLRFVQQRPSKEPKLFLLEGRFGGNRGSLRVEPTLFIEDDKGDFSDEMKSIYGTYKEGH